MSQVELVNTVLAQAGLIDERHAPYPLKRLRGVFIMAAGSEVEAE